MTFSFERALKRGSAFGDGLRCHAQQDRHQPDRAHEPSLPHAPGEGGDGKHHHEARRAVGLRKPRQQADPKRDERACDRRQQHADSAHLVPALQEDIVGVLSRGALEHEALGPVVRTLHLRLHGGRGIDADADPRVLEHALGRVLPDDDARAGGTRQPRCKMKPLIDRRTGRAG